MIENRKQLEHSIRAVAKMYNLRDQDASETLYDPETREDVVESTKAMIHRIEREIASYFCAHADAGEDPVTAPLDKAA